MTTAFVYDPFERNHSFPGHPECRERMESTWMLLQSDGILDSLTRLPNSPAPLDPILAVHNAAYVEQLQEICQEIEKSASDGHTNPQSWNQSASWLDPDTYVLHDSWQASLRAVGGLLQLTDAVMSGAAGNGFAMVRPPGHHARPHNAKGFCLFGNVAVAARHAQQSHGADRVLIVDFDVHHGNGTEEMFYDDPSVLFISIHQFPHYPFSGSIDEIGHGPGEGFNVNIPFPASVGDAGYLAALQQLVTPLAREFRPDVIFLSAGFDGHWMDPLSGHRLSISGYTALVEELLALAQALCSGRLVCTLEGGYDLNALPHCILSTLRALSRNPAGSSDPFGAVKGNPRAADKVISAVKRRLRIR
ncbi:MAG: histone deacetylase [Caldilineaceae bacterium]|nr:histone deacetylase [Caldilineaceae bacterium]